MARGGPNSCSAWSTRCGPRSYQRPAPGPARSRQRSGTSRAEAVDVRFEMHRLADGTGRQHLAQGQEVGVPAPVLEHRQRRGLWRRRGPAALAPRPRSARTACRPRRACRPRSAWAASGAWVSLGVGMTTRSMAGSAQTAANSRTARDLGQGSAHLFRAARDDGAQLEAGNALISGMWKTRAGAAVGGDRHADVGVMSAGHAAKMSSSACAHHRLVGVDAGPVLDADAALADQHGEPVDDRGSRVPRRRGRSGCAAGWG